MTLIPGSIIITFLYKASHVLNSWRFASYILCLCFLSEMIQLDYHFSDLKSNACDFDYCY
jgi:hypothetical protein